MSDAAGSSLAVPQRRIDDAPMPAIASRMRAFLAAPGRARLAVLALGAAAAMAALLAMLAIPDRTPVYVGLADSDKAAVVDTLAAAGIGVELNAATGEVEVARADLHAARMRLAAAGIPDAAPLGDDPVEVPFGSSRAIEQARLLKAREAELARSIAEISGVEGARVHLALPQASAFVRDRSPPSASVLLRLRPGRALDEAQVLSIVHLVAASVPGLAAGNVSVVDQRGTLLSSKAGGLEGDGGQQLRYRRAIEQLWRDRLHAVLAPTLGRDNYSAEVALDLDFRVEEAARERFEDKGVLTDERGSAERGSAPAARGIPGALSNVAPPAARIFAPADAGDADAASDAPEPASPTTTAEEFARNYAVGKEVSVERAAYGEVRRASIAVVVRARSASVFTETDRRAIEALVKGAIGFSAERGDTVVVTSRPFAEAAIEPALPLWREPQTQALAGNVLVALAALAAAFVLARTLRRTMSAPPSAAAQAPAAAEPAQEFEARLQLLRQLVQADRQRANAAVGRLMRGETNG